MSIKSYFGVIAVSAALGSGCQEAPPEETEQLQQKVVMPWSPGNSSGGFAASFGDLVNRGFRKVTLLSGATVYYLMTIDLNTGVANDAAAVVDGIFYNGQPVTSLTTTQGWFVVSTGSFTNRKVSGSGFQLDFHIAAPVNGTLRLSASTDAATYGRYSNHFLADAAGSTWEPMCKHWYSDGQGTAQLIAEPFIPVPGLKWIKNGSSIDDSAAISFGCTNDAIGACVDWGYAPWDSVIQWSGFPPQAKSVSLKNYHQACTRMKRADFCGNGTGNTSDFNSPTNATIIQVWDALGIHPMAPQTLATMEASWDGNGATCVNPSRLRAHSPYYTALMTDQLNNVCPGKPTCSGGSTSYVSSGRPCYQDPNTQAWLCP